MRKRKLRISPSYSRYRRRMAIKLNRLGLTAEAKKRELRLLTQCCLDRRIYDLPQPAPKPPKFQITTEEYRQLPIMSGWEEYCRQCRRFTSPAVSLRSPQGPVQVVICDHCGLKMKPYQRRGFQSNY